MKIFIKRRGKKEEYDHRKLKLSIFAACLNAHLTGEHGEVIADKVVITIREFLEKANREVTSDEIFEKATQEIQKLNEAAAFMYRSHRDIS
jgi:transcriptional regulator NrdR family protein